MATESASARAVGLPGGGSSSEGADGGSVCGRCLGGICQIDAKSRTRVAHGNVRALDEEDKVVTLVGQLRRYNVMICGVCNTKLADSGSTEIEDYTLWCSGSKDGRLQLGVGIAVSNRMEKHVSKFELVDERIVLLRLKFKVCNVTVIEAYAPSEPAKEDSRKRFYNKLQEILESVPKHDVLLLLGDFGAQVGTNYDYWGARPGPARDGARGCQRSASARVLQRQ
uniref:Craniofacial development protein 2-like isoform X2 n=1 Tax=Petromyzon marinus TaxID=7757 RepID=A0AAJ7WSG5_PETMA|nr:craniofacial development protein 2-like isoform X2 [Petromyzon marinus]XP_032808519.1 craniofacial development protein 2-like isoform X2 [Petromyzon marinus]XP_032808520.1 craniofacial development protein 2-like isoform X2 [Petromyzon marinus]XP_032808521.1 craniofacial development protein 2-like isoform X2 [Petromyzon marinus]XP_032808522.1 craniofacial development protein 2-like isoform X2 [Petromyzon marinus]